MASDIVPSEQSPLSVDVRDDQDSKYFCCPNGHPYSVPRCGWPMEVSRCIECREMVGGHDHMLLSTNLRISKADCEWLLEYWNKVNRQEICAEKLPEDDLVGLRSRAVHVTKRIRPDEFDSVSLHLKNAVVHALLQSAHAAEAAAAVQSPRAEGNNANFLLPLSPPSADQAQLPSRVDVEASGKRVILCFGDSLTAGLTACHRFRPYSFFLGELLASQVAEGSPEYMVVNAGVCGETTQEMCRRFRALLGEYEDLLAWVLILGGTNDLPECQELGSTALMRTVENLKQLHCMVHSAGCNSGARTVVMTLPDCTQGGTAEVTKLYEQEQQEINCNLRAFAEHRADSILIDVAMSFAQDQVHAEDWEPNGPGSGDGVHFSETGYRALANLVVEQLRKDAAERGWPGSVELSGSRRGADRQDADCPMADMV